MSAPLVSIIVPTHNHGPTLRSAVSSALAQTHAELEVLIVGDGMPAEAAAAARELEREHERVRLFEFEKGERHGEAHRHEVLSNDARGEYVFYLCDDDLYLPGHVETLLAVLFYADFVSGTCCVTFPDNSLEIYPHDISRPYTRELMLSTRRQYSHAALSCISHSMAAYRRLPKGWSPAPKGVRTDIHFVRKFVGSAETFHCLSVQRVTVIHLPSPTRLAMSTEERATELDWWRKRIASADGLAAIEAELEAAYRMRAVDADLDYQLAHDHVHEAYDREADMQRWMADLEANAGRLERHIAAINALPELRLRRSRVGHGLLSARARLRRQKR